MPTDGPNNKDADVKRSMLFLGLTAQNYHFGNFRKFPVKSEAIVKPCHIKVGYF